jgi:hypothetical protein
MRSILAASACLVAFTAPAHADESECPAAFQGVQVSAAELRDGVSIDFRNPNRAHVRQMRVQLREVAEMLEQHGTQLQTTGDEDEHVEFPPVDLDVKNITTGARVTVRAARLRDVPVIRELAFGFAEFWGESPCAAAPPPPLVSRK